MNVHRFAGDNPIFQKFAEQTAVNEQLMRRRQAEAMQNAQLQRQRDVQAAQGIVPTFI